MPGAARRTRRYASLFGLLQQLQPGPLELRRALARWQCEAGNLEALSVESGELFVRLLRALEAGGEAPQLRAAVLECLRQDLAKQRPPAPGRAAAEALDPDCVPPEELHEWRTWYEHLIYQVAREDELVHQRLTWLMQFEGFLFTAFGFILAARVELTPQPLQLAFMGLISSVGLAGAFAVQRGVHSAHLVLDSLKRAYLASFERYKTSHVRPFGKHSEHRQLVSVMLPWTMMSAWGLIQLTLLYRIFIYHAR